MKDENIYAAQIKQKQNKLLCFIPYLLISLLKSTSRSLSFDVSVRYPLSILGAFCLLCLSSGLIFAQSVLPQGIVRNQALFVQEGVEGAINMGDYTQEETNEGISRGELVELVVREAYPDSSVSVETDELYKDVIEKCIEVPFDDVPRSYNPAKYICLAKKKGLVSGYSDNLFKPNAKITLEQAAKIILKSQNVKVEEGGYVRELVDRNAVPRSLQCLDSNVARGEVREMINRIKNNITTKESKSYKELKYCHLDLNQYNFTSPIGDASCSGVYFGRGWSRGHTGVDFPIRDKDGCWIRSIGEGEVTRARWCRSLGFCVVVEHPNGYQSLYAHGNGNFAVREGDLVEPGQQIMYMGRSGNASTVHLHFSLSFQTDVVNNYFERIDPVRIVPLGI